MTFAHRGNASTTRLDFFVGSSGETLAQPNTPGNYSGALVATDSAGATTRVHSWNFSVVPARVFGIEPGLGWQTGPPMSGTDGYMNQYVVGETYQLPKPTLSNADLFTGYSGSDPATITFSMEFTTSQTASPEPELLCEQRGGNARAANS